MSKKFLQIIAISVALLVADTTVSATQCMEIWDENESRMGMHIKKSSQQINQLLQLPNVKSIQVKFSEEEYSKHSEYRDFGTRERSNTTGGSSGGGGVNVSFLGIFDFSVGGRGDTSPTTSSYKRDYGILETTDIKFKPSSITEINIEFNETNKLELSSRIEQAKTEGVEEGGKKAAIEIAQNFLSKKIYSLETISQMTGLSVEEISKLKTLI